MPALLFGHSIYSRKSKTYPRILQGQLYSNPLKKWNIEIKKTRIAVDDTEIRAPVTGTVIMKPVEKGQVISSPAQDFAGGTLLMSMADLVGVQIRSLSFDVIGVLESKGSSGWRNPDDDIWVPLSTAQFRVAGDDRVESISAKVLEGAPIERAMVDIERILRREHGILLGADNDFGIMNRKQFLDSRQGATEVFTFLLAGIAGVSLIVGGIGIMLVTVTERAREVGIRKAMGATNGNILLQFLVEAMTLCLLGGGLGLAVGAAASYFAAEFAGWQTQVNSTSVVMAFTLSAVVGLVFGMWPAKRAASLDPIDALRYE